MFTSHSSTEQKIAKSVDDGEGLPIVTDTYNYSEADIQFAFFVQSRVC